MSLEGMAEQEGIKITHVVGGAKKVDWSPYKDLNDSGRQTAQKLIDRSYNQFVDAVSQYRNIDAEIVRETQAEILSSQAALELGLIDRIDTFDNTLGALQERVKSASYFTGATFMKIEEMTAAQLKQARPDLCEQLEKTGATAAAANQQSAIDAAIKADRERFASIVQSDEAKGREKLAMSLAAKGMSASDAKELLESAPQQQTTTVHQEANAPKGSALDRHMAALGNPQIKTENEPLPANSQQSINASWDAAFGRSN